MSDKYTLHHGDCLDVMRQMEDNSIDTVITDPPYHLVSINKRFSKTSPDDDNKTAEDARNGAHQYARLSSGFMGKEWDGGGIAFDPATWAEVLRVAKPGAMLLAFGGTRTYHRLACAIEDAGWIIRDCVMYLYGSGFPKSHDISKAIDKRAGAEREVVGNIIRSGEAYMPEAKGRDGKKPAGKPKLKYNITAPATDAARLWDGWGTALKPAWEPIILAMKPLDGTFAENALRWGVAGLWIDGARIEYDKTESETIDFEREQGGVTMGAGSVAYTKSISHTKSEYQKANVKTWKPQGRWPANLILSDDPEVTAGFPNSKSTLFKMKRNNDPTKSIQFMVSQGYAPDGGYDDSVSAARYFYCAKASKSERNHGLPDGMTNKHPTVKPVSLCQYLARLTKTPTGGIVLDPFCGSGSIGVAAILEGRQFIGIDQDADSIEVARYRLDAAVEETAVTQMELELNGD